MNPDQTNSLIRTFLKIAGTALAAHGMSSSAALVNSEDVFGLIVLLVGLIQSHQTHADPLVALMEKFAAGPAPAPQPITHNQGDGGNATPKAIGAEPTAVPAPSVPAPSVPAPSVPAPAAPPVTLVTFHDKQ